MHSILSFLCACLIPSKDSKGENTSEFREAWMKIKIPISEILIIIITIIVDWAVKNNK